MGGMGRDFDGGYEEHALLPAAHVIPVTTTLDWARLGSLPESFGTAWGSLGVLGLGAGADGARARRDLVGRPGRHQPGQDAGLTVLATTRREDRLGVLRAGGADHAVLDDGRLVAAVRQLVPDGVDGLLELVGPQALLGSLQALRPGRPRLPLGVPRGRLGHGAGLGGRGPGRRPARGASRAGR